MKKLDPLVFPILPTLVDGFPIKPDTLYYVGNGDHFVAAFLKDGHWRHAVVGTKAYGHLIEIEPRYVLCAQDDTRAYDNNATPVDAASTTPRDAEQRGQWDCGNGHLTDQLTLLLVERNRIRDEAAIETIAGSAYNAGPAFCSEMIEALRPSNCEVPF